MFGVCMRLFYVCVALCLGCGLSTGCSLVQGVPPSVKNDYRGLGPERGGRAIEKSMIRGSLSCGYKVFVFCHITSHI
jgi:hypothetical protein